MRRLTRAGLAMLGLTLSAPLNVWADSPAAPEAAAVGGNAPASVPGAPSIPLTVEPNVVTSSAPAGAPNAPSSTLPGGPSSLFAGPAYQPPVVSPAAARPTRTASAAKPAKHHKGLFRRCHCPECQRAAVLARDGVHVPPPPAAPMPGMEMNVNVSQADPNCAACEGQGTVTVVEGPVTTLSEGPATTVAAKSAPGRAVVTDRAPGYAVVGQPTPIAEPAPVGVVRPRYGPSLAAVPPSAAPRDPMLSTTSAAPDPLTNARHNRPHVLSHLIPIEVLGKRRRMARERAREEAHASIAYGPQNEEQQDVSELPASMVYGRRHP
jgi:hypothetical protein